MGRENELEALQHFLDLAVSGKGCTVFISGEAGSGKTRMVSEFLNRLRERDVTVLSGWCLSNAAVPYFPFVEMFESLTSLNKGDGQGNSQLLLLKNWLLNENEQGISAQAWKEQKFSGIMKELLFLSTEKPLILFIDDLHWADSASLVLLHYISRNIAAERIMLLSAFRHEELMSPHEGSANPLTDSLRLLEREDLYREIKLSNLNQTHVCQIAESMLGARVHPDIVAKLGDESQGNPLFIIETFKMLFENGGLIKEEDSWHLSTDKMSIPIKVKDIILRRLSVLKINQRRTLDVASVIGENFDTKLLGAVLNYDSLEVLETLNSLAQSKSLVTVDGDYYKFDHAKTREVLYNEILLPLKKGYHQRIAEKIESLNQNQKQPPVNDLAYHYEQAGNTEKSIKYHLEDRASMHFQGLVTLKQSNIFNTS